MNTKNYLTPTKKYKSLVSSSHSIFRLVNSTYELKDLISRLAKLICQIFNTQNCTILLLDPTKRYSVLKCLISNKKRSIIEQRLKISNGIEKKILKKHSVIRKDNLLG